MARLSQLVRGEGGTKKVRLFLPFSLPLTIQWNAKYDDSFSGTHKERLEGKEDGGVHRELLRVFQTGKIGLVYK